MFKKETITNNKTTLKPTPPTVTIHFYAQKFLKNII